MARSKTKKPAARRRGKKVLRPPTVGAAPKQCRNCGARLVDDKCVVCCPKCGYGVGSDGRCQGCDLDALRDHRTKVGMMFKTPNNEAVAFLLDLKIAELSLAVDDDTDD